MKRVLLFVTINLLGLNVMFAQNELSLKDAINQARSQSTNSKIAESIKENKYYQLLNFKAGLRPQLSLSGNLADYSRDYFGVVQPDGTLIFQPRTQNYSSVGLSLSQQISATGGTMAINSNLTRFDDFNRRESRYSGIPVNISLNQPLFAFNSYKWDKKIEPLKYQEAEKEYIREGENIALQVSKLYFNVLDAQNNLELARKNIEVQNIIFAIENKRIDLGTTTKDRILQIKLQLLTSTQDLSQAEVDLKTSTFSLKSFMGSNTSHINVVLPETLPKINLTVEEAVSAAKKNRAEFIAYRRKKLEAEKELEAAKKDRFRVNLVTAYGYNNIGDRFGAVYSNPNSQQQIRLGVQLPVLDWGRNKGRISVATSNLKTIKYSSEQDEIALLQEITNLVENIKLISTNIEVAKEADLIAQERYLLANERFRFGKISITDLNIASAEKDNAKRSFINALRTFWESYYQLKALTLLDLASD